MYKVIKFFTDLQDNKHPYNVGDTFPREGKKATKARLKELSTAANRQGVPLIEEVKDETPKDETPKDETGETGDTETPQ